MKIVFHSICPLEGFIFSVALRQLAGVDRIRVDTKRVNITAGDRHLLLSEVGCCG